MIALFLFGLLIIIRGIIVQPYFIENTPPYLRSTIIGIYFGAGREGTSLIQPVVGHYMDIFSITEVFNFIALAGVVLSLILVVVIIINFRRKWRTFDVR